MRGYQKQPLTKTLSQFTKGRIAQQLQLAGKALPASLVSIDGSIATVNFEIQTDTFTLPNVTVPVVGSEYVRLPLQAGCQGVLLPASVLLGGVSGLGSGTASLNQPANLSALIFLPIGNVNFSAPTDPDKIELYGPAGVILRDAANTASVTVSANSIVLKVGSNNITITSSGISITGTLTINTKLYTAHEHTLVQVGTGISGPVAP